MGGNSSWMPGCHYDTYPSFVQILRTFAEEQEQALSLKTSEVSFES